MTTGRYSSRICIGIDPGFATTGVGIIEQVGNRFTPLYYGAITTPKEQPFPERIHTIHQELTAIIQQFKPQFMAIEDLFFSKNTKTAIKVAQARGIMLLAGQEQGLEVCEYKPIEVKLAVSGYGRADKKQVQEMVKSLLKLSEVPKPDDVADALAVAICHCHSYRVHSLT